MTLAGISIKRPVATTMVMISMIFIGIIAMFTMKTELLPNTQIPTITVTTTWQGAVPDDVETQVTKKIEEVLSNVEGIDKIASTSSFGSSSIVINFDFNVDINIKATEIQREVSKLTSDLPKDAETPVVKKIDAGSGNTTMILMFSSLNINDLVTFLDQYFKPKLERLNGVGEVNIYGSAEKQIQIQVDSDKLAVYNLSPMELYDIIKNANLNVPLGSINTGKKQFTARFMGETNSIEKIKSIVIKSNGNMMKLEDVADIIYTTEDEDIKAYLRDEKSIFVVIEKSSDGSTIELNEEVLKALESLETSLPPDTTRQILVNTTEDIQNAISNISSSAMQGLLLATLIIFIFLKNVRATLVASAALPVAIIFTFAFLSLSGSSLNLVSLMGLSIGVGMLTDNSVVVIDNIYRYMTEFKSPVIEASELGTVEVTSSVVASSLTTMVVFIPILFIPGMSREIFRDLAYAIIFSNIAALIVSLTLIPMLSSKVLSDKMNITKEGKLFKKIKNIYIYLLKKAMTSKKIFLSIVIAIFVFTLIVPSRSLKVKFFPSQDKGRYSIVAELGKGIDLEKSDIIAKEIEEIVKKENPETYFIIVKNETIAVNVNIGKKNTRKTTVFDTMDRMRKKVEQVPGIKLFLTEDFSISGDQQRDVQFDIVGQNLDEIKEVGRKVLEIMSKESGVVDIKSTLDPGITELRFVLDREKIKSYDIDTTVVGQHLNYYILGGDKSDTVTVKTGIEEIDVLLRLPKEKRSDIGQLMNLNIKIGPEKYIKLSDIATIEMVEGTSEINKTDRIYSVSISANDGGIGIRAIQNLFVKAYNEINPPKSISYSWGSDSDNLSKTSSQLAKALLISIFLIYALLASQFESFSIPIIILGSLPLALIGVIWGLIITNQALDVMVMIGVIMLAGIVVNNAIVLVDFIKMERSRGSTRENAILEASKTRLRPILMTTMTTVCGMIPMSLGIGEGAEVYRGLAVTVMFGLTFSTVLTLFLISILYILLEDINDKFKEILKFLYNVTFGRFENN